jgi:ATP-dependent Lhr-like helicase
MAVHHEDKTVQLTPAGGGVPPLLDNGSVEVHLGVRTRMRTLLEGDAVPAYLDRRSRTLLEQARREYASLELDQAPITIDGSDTLLFPWNGDRALNTLAEILNTNGMSAAVEGPCYASSPPLRTPLSPPSRRSLAAAHRHRPIWPRRSRTRRTRNSTCGSANHS